MLRRALFASLTMSLASLPAASLAYDIKPKTAEFAFAAKMRPDILGISTDSTAESARAIFESAFKGRVDTKTDIQQQKFGIKAVSYIAALTFDFPSAPETDRRSAFEQLLLARERKSRLFHHPKPDVCARPAAVQDRDDKTGHG